MELVPESTVFILFTARVVLALCLGVVAFIFLYKSLERDEPRVWLYWGSSLIGGSALILFMSAFVR